MRRHSAMLETKETRDNSGDNRYWSEKANAHAVGSEDVRSVWIVKAKTN